MEAEAIRAKIKEIIADVANLDPHEIADDASFVEDLNLDSMSLLEISVDLDFQFKLGLPDEEFNKLRSVREAVELVERLSRQRRAQGGLSHAGRRPQRPQIDGGLGDRRTGQAGPARIPAPSGIAAGPEPAATRQTASTKAHVGKPNAAPAETRDHLETPELPKKRPARVKARRRKALLHGIIFVGCTSLLTVWSLRTIAAEVRDILDENPVVQEHLGKIDRIKFQGYDARGQWLFGVSGARGSGQVQATIISDWGEVEAIGGGTLELPSGVRYELLAAFDSVLEDPAHLKGGTDSLRALWNVIQPLRAVLPVMFVVLAGLLLLVGIVEYFSFLDQHG